MNTTNNSGPPWRLTATGILLTVRLTPNASVDAIDGTTALSDGRNVLAIRVRAVPEKGKANAALVKTLAKWLSMPKSALMVATGLTSRLKTVSLDGDTGQLAERLTAKIVSLDINT